MAVRVCAQALCRQCTWRVLPTCLCWECGADPGSSERMAPLRVRCGGDPPLLPALALASPSAQIRRALGHFGNIGTCSGSDGCKSLESSYYAAFASRLFYTSGLERVGHTLYSVQVPWMRGCQGSYQWSRPQRITQGIAAEWCPLDGNTRLDNGRAAIGRRVLPVTGRSRLGVAGWST